MHRDLSEQERLFRVVGIGASAGGVEAFTRLLRASSPDSGMAFVLLSHLSPSHPSELSRLFAPLTRMPVEDAAEGQTVEPNHVYVLPADGMLTIAGERLHLTDRAAGNSPPTVIDQFLESLAIDLGPRAVGVILSGTGSDGTAGLEAVKAHGGTTYAQDPALAAYEGMPRSAVQSGAVDFTLPLEGIAQALGELGPSPLSRASSPVTSRAPPADDRADEAGLLDPELLPTEVETLGAIIQILATTSGVDFQHYKKPSILRRIRRRASDLGLSDLGDYLSRLRQDAAEVAQLFQAVLIHVTRFFREPETFETLRATILPSLVTSRSGGEAVRAWVVGCATGEEVYSLAMSFLEVEADLGKELSIRIFASDVSDPALGTARQGRYPETIRTDVSPARLAQFFTPVDHGYRVAKRLREMCVFAHHDVTRDPPFAQLDMILCCNVLIYLDPLLQRRLLQNMHYSLKAGGYLVLGRAETITGVEALFTAVDLKRRIYLRRPGPAGLPVSHGPHSAKRPWALQIIPGVQPAPPEWSTAELQRAAERAFFANHLSASVIVNEEFNVLHFQGVTGPYLQAPTGGPTVQLMKLAHPDLRLVLGRMLRRVKKENAAARTFGVRFGAGKAARGVHVSVIPLALEVTEHHYLVVFEEAPAKDEAGHAVAPSANPGKASRVLELEAELAENKEYIQACIDQHDATLAELQAAYETSQSVREEYQSTNEELESAKEELQSLNEELTTVNEQVQQRNAELLARSGEVTGLLKALDMPILLITRDLRLRAFNSRAADDFHFTMAKVGTELDSASLPVSQIDLRALVERAFEGAEVQELELKDEQGQWRALRVWPVHSEGKDGTAAIAFIDIAKLKDAVDQEHELRSYSEAIIETVFEPLVVLDGDLRMLRANAAFHHIFGTQSAHLVGRKLGELGDAGWNISELEAFLERARKSEQTLSTSEVTLESSRLGQRIFRLSMGRIRQESDHLLLALEDMTERKRTEAALLEVSRMQAAGQIAGGVAHEINNQMTVVIGLTKFLLEEPQVSDQSRADLGHIERAAERSAAVVQQLLAFSRRLPLRPVVFELNVLVGATTTLLRRTLGPNIALELMLGSRVGQVWADKAQLEQVLVNLCLNAQDAMDGKGQLRIETTTVTLPDTVSTAPNTAVVPGGIYARLIVNDSGGGMDSITKTRIFEPFFTTKPVGKGTGLGLASVYGVVKQSGGVIGVESELGRGTTFTIDLPQVLAADVPVPKQVAAASVAVGGTEVILVVDDEETVRAWVIRSLQRLGYVTLEASDAEEALRLTAEARPSVELVLSDVLMPGMGGGQLRHRLAALRPELPVLLMSGFALTDLVREGTLKPEAILLQKPFTADALAVTVRKVLDTARKALPI